MQIIFDSEAEKEKIVENFVESDSCPSDVWMEDGCTDASGDCKACWKTALETVEKKEG